jgi:hypothetical protein
MDEQQQKLISLVEAYRDRECDSLFAQARYTSKELIHNAYREARQRFQNAVERERPRAVLRIRRADAELHTKKRAVEQRNAQALLRQGWTLLARGLQERWQDDQSRHAWVTLCATTAMGSLPMKHWTVTHPSDCDAETLSYFKDLITARSADIVIDLQENADISAGLIVDSGARRLDMSMNGLLKDKTLIEARMLALLNRSEDT